MEFDDVYHYNDSILKKGCVSKMDGYEILREEKRLDDLLKDVGVEDLGSSSSGKVLYVVVRGDWKHDHLRCQYLLEEDGYGMVSKRVTEDDGSDWYKAEYSFRRK